MTLDHQYVVAVGDNLLAFAAEHDVRLPHRLRDHLGSTVGARRVGFYWLDRTRGYLNLKGFPVPTGRNLP